MLAITSEVSFSLTKTNPTWDVSRAVLYLLRQGCIFLCAFSLQQIARKVHMNVCLLSCGVWALLKKTQ